MLKRGVCIKRYAIDKSMTIKKLIRILDTECINEVAVFDGKQQISVLTQDKLFQILQKGDLYAPIQKYLA